MQRRCFSRAMEFARSGGYQFCWMKSGRIYLKKNEQSQTERYNVDILSSTRGTMRSSNIFVEPSTTGVVVAANASQVEMDLDGHITPQPDNTFQNTSQNLNRVISESSQNRLTNINVLAHQSSMPSQNIHSQQ